MEEWRQAAQRKDQLWIYCAEAGERPPPPDNHVTWGGKQTDVHAPPVLQKKVEAEKV